MLYLTDDVFASGTIKPTHKQNIVYEWVLFLCYLCARHLAERSSSTLA